MRNSVRNLVMALALVVMGVVAGVPLILYSEADDAPGGVLLGIVLMIGAGALGVKIARRPPTGSPSHRMLEERCRALEVDLHATQSQLDELQSHVGQLEEKLAFTQSLLESRNPSGAALPPRP
jgi:hypothetical protein